jgi:predicted transcriptional regulator
MTTMNREEQKAAREKNNKLDKMLLLLVSVGPCTTITLAKIFKEPPKRIGRRFQHLIGKGFVRRVRPGQWVKEGKWTLTRI